MNTPLTEDETIDLLLAFLKQKDWSIESVCYGRKRGYDIVARKIDQKLIVEVKGARASNTAPNKKREKFDSGQLKTHLGKAIVKCFDTRDEHPNALLAIAHPKTPYLIDKIGPAIKHLAQSEIIHFWVSDDGNVETLCQTNIKATFI